MALRLAVQHSINIKQQLLLASQNDFNWECWQSIKIKYKIGANRFLSFRYEAEKVKKKKKNPQQVRTQFSSSNLTTNLMCHWFGNWENDTGV